MTFILDPAANQPQKRVQMLAEIESWAKWMPDWAWWWMASLRPIIKRGGHMTKEDEEKLWKCWKATNFNKTKGIIPKSEDRPAKKKVKSWVD